MNKNISLWILAIVSLVGLTSCDDFLDITPTGKVIAKTCEEYRDLLTYEYDNFPSDRSKTALRGDELTLSASFTSSDDYASYFDIWRWNDDAPSSTTSSFGWRRYYHAIYISNYIIEHQHEITNGTSQEISQLVGESYMMRAFSHFTLVNLYAEPYTHCQPDTTRGVPLMLEADVNAVPYSSSVADVYNQVLADIDSAQNHLNVEKWETGKNYRFSTVSAQALRARVMLYMGNWSGALQAAQQVISAHPDLEDLNTSTTLPDSYKSVESILALESNMSAEYATIGRPSSQLLSLYVSGDQRRTKYYRRATTTSYTLLKGNSDDLMCTFRSAEFYLIAAECEARLGDTSAAIDYLKTLMVNRYNTTAYSTQLERLQTMSQQELIDEILNERARELAFEGHRWMDLRRTTMHALTKTYGTDTYTLDEGDSRYTLRFPSEAVEANPNIEIWPVPNR
jgi:hypothetical protein